MSIKGMMILVTPSRRRHQYCLAAIIAMASLAVEARQTIDEPFEHWAAMHALVGMLEPGRDGTDLQRLAPIIGTARVVALGEPAHGAHEPLAFRNRLFQYLVEEHGFTAIAIESGLPESRRVQDFVAGGQGDVGAIVHDNLSYNFGALGENVELVQWMRAYNADASHRRTLRFYGMDLSIGGPRGYTPTPVPLEAALAYLARVDGASAERQRRTLAPFIARLPAAASFSPAEHQRLSAAIDELVSRLERHRRTFIAATSEADYAWAERNAILARQAEREFRVALPGPPGGPMLPGDWRATEARDQAMAGNVRWALDREGPAGRILVFAHNAHVKGTPTAGGIWDVFARPPNSMGVYLRSTLNQNLVIIGTSSVANPPGFPPFVPDDGSLDAALGRVGVPQFLLDLRTSRDDRAVTAWLAERRTLRANFTSSLRVSPAKSFDALLFIHTLTRAHIASPPR
jgi:erythromycin esterase